MYKSIAIASACFAAVVAGLPSTSKRASGFVTYTGNGANWPQESDWLPFDVLFQTNEAAISASCVNNGWGADNTAQDTSNIKSAIQQVATTTGVNPSFIFAIMFQESKGCVGVPTTNNGVRNPGLMQSHDGAGTCAGATTCPMSEITQMIEDGVQGTSSGDGLVQCLAAAQKTGSSGSLAAYQAARMYNSGSVDFSDLGAAVGATASYASDVANILVGHVQS